MTRSEFEHIAAQLRQRVLKTGLDFFGNREDAEDVAQETMVQLWRYLEHIDAERNVEALAVRVAKNCCVSLYRKQKQSADIQALRHLETEDSPHARLEAEDTRRMLEETVALLKPRERQLFEMRAVMGLSTDEITAQTGIPKLSVTAMVSAARKKVFTELKRRMKQ
jgi:RNA polymerase sigma factor (sigma-70 family)